MTYRILPTFHVRFLESMILRRSQDSIDSGNGVTPNRWEVIDWINLTDWGPSDTYMSQLTNHHWFR